MPSLAFQSRYVLIRNSSISQFRVAQILTGVKPFAYTSSDVDVVMALYHNELPYSPPAQSLLGNCAVDQTFWDLMKNCWNGNPDERPGMHHVCNVLAQVDSILQRDKNPGQHRSRM
jgi:hypothetical protein